MALSKLTTMKNQCANRTVTFCASLGLSISSLNEYANWVGKIPGPLAKSMFNNSYNLNLLMSGCMAIVACIACGPADAQVTTGSNTQWLRGKALQESKLLPVSVSWTNSPLRDQLYQFAQQRKRAIFLDRRVDPTLQQTSQLLRLTTEQIVWKTAEANGLGVARVGNLLYVGPKDTAARLPFVIKAVEKQARKLDKATRNRWNARRELRWPAATSTKEITAWFSTSLGVKFSSDVAFDVLPETDWPQLSAAEQVSIFLACFDAAIVIEEKGNAAKLVAFPKIESGTMKINLRSQGKFDLKAAQRQFDDLKIRKSGKSLTVSGAVTSIAKLESWLVSRQQVKSDGDLTGVFDVNQTGRRRDFLKSLANQTDRKLVFDGEAPQILQDRITLNLKGVSLETLIEKCLEGTGLRYELDSNSVKIIAASQ